MAEKVLPYNRAIVRQETPYWCGPASTQIVLDTRGVHVAEADLARELGTHRGGTDYVGLVLPSLNNRLPGASYRMVEMPNDPPTAAQRDRLWRDLVRSIDAGYGVVVNWVAPPRNYPRGVKGSISPRYSGGTVYHYVAAMGYDDNPSLRAVWIADPGFQPQGYWISFDQLATLIPPKGYAYADAEPTGPVGPDPVSVLSRAMGGRLSIQRYHDLLPAVGHALRASQCTTVERIAMWCAQIGHESGGLYHMEEIASGAAYEGRTDLGNTQPGDGVRFKGRGPIQVTGRHNYTELSRWAHGQGLVPTPTFFVDLPHELASDTYGFIGAIWYWTVARPQINSLCDRRDLEGVTRAINGGLNGLADRRTRYQRALAMGDELLALTGDIEGDDMAQVPQHEWERVKFLIEEIAGVRRPSRSRARKLNSTHRDTAIGYAWAADGFGHEDQVVRDAVKFGRPDAIALLMEVASAAEDPARYPDRQADAEWAAEVLARVSDEAIERTFVAIGRWLDAEAAYLGGQS